MPTPVKIFVVDDDRSAREAIEALIQSLGHDTESFDSAEECLSCGHIADAACLITDVQMPGMTGFDLYRRLLVDGYGIAVVFMSAHPGEAMRAAAMEAGAIDFLNKPINVRHLMDCLSRALKIHSS